MTVGSFLLHMVHSLSRTTIRIPPGPENAYRWFCGPGVPTPVVRALASSSWAWPERTEPPGPGLLRQPFMPDA